ncbi:MAG: hypothetical protein ACRC2T_07390 [Thermoguttaceae bacterium]
MFSIIRQAKDNQYQTLKNSGTEPTNSRLDSRSIPIPNSAQDTLCILFD